MDKSSMEGRPLVAETLLLVDFENVPKLDLSALDAGTRVLIFVGASQNPPKRLTRTASTKTFSRIEFQKIAGNGKNALDFHIAFHLGRIFETAPATKCIVLAKDKGYDPLLLHLNENGLDCRRVSSLAELILKASPNPGSVEDLPGPVEPETDAAVTLDPELTVCRRCSKASTIEHYGGRWCTNCGSFASPPDPDLLPSMQPGYRPPRSRYFSDPVRRVQRQISHPVCGWCHQRSDMTGGIYDDGEWMCGWCVGRLAR